MKAKAVIHAGGLGIRISDEGCFVLQQKDETWRVTLVDAGENAATGGHLKRVADDIRDEKAFCITSGYGVSVANVHTSIVFHCNHGNLAMAAAVRPPEHFGVRERDGDLVTEGFRAAARPPWKAWP